MLIRTIIVVCALALSLSAFATKGDAEPHITEIGTPKELISLYAQKYGASEKQLLGVASCESQFKPNAINYNDGGKGKHSVGIFQYQKSTFNQFDNLIGEDLDYYSYHDQAKLTAYVFANYPNYKSHWTCYRVLYT